jgi:hypothetical protein
MKWLDRLNKKAPDDLKLNLVHIVFWAVIFGVGFGVLLLSGCGSDSNPLNPDNAGEFCDVHGGVQLIEQGYVYCQDGTYIEEDAL